MKKIFVWFCLICRRQLKSKIFIFLLVAVPFAAFAVSNMEEFGEKPDNYIALLPADDDENALNTINALINNTNGYDFYLCGTRDELMDDVRSNKAECGYIFNENITDMIKNGTYKKCITVVYRENSILKNTVNETVFSEFFKYFSKVFVMDYVEKSEEFAGIDSGYMELLEGTYDKYLNGAETFGVIFEELGDGEDFSDTQVIEGGNVTFPLRGVMAVLAMAGMLLGVLAFDADREKGVFCAMPYNFINTARAIYVIVPSIFITASMVISVFVSGNSEGICKEIAAAALYVILLAFAGVIVSFILRRSFFVAVFLPLSVMLALAVCPVFIDIAQYVPQMGVLRYIFVPYYYMVMF